VLRPFFGTWRAWGFVKGHQKDCNSESLLREREMATCTMRVGPSSMQFVPHNFMIRPTTKSLVGFADLRIYLALERGTPTSDKQLLKIECDDTEYRRFANVAQLNLEHARMPRKRARPSTFGITGQLAAQPTSKYSGTTQSGGSKKKTQQ
jgi:hypothetical protein